MKFVYSVCFAFALLAGTVSAATLTPYLQSPTPSSIWITWWDATPTDSSVDYGTVSNTLAATTSGGSALAASGYRYHYVQLSNLTPNTFYYYKARSGSNASITHRFRTPPALGTSTGRVRILVMGDHQLIDPPRYQTLVGRAKAKIEALYGVPIEESINLVLNDGDQVDTGTASQYVTQHFNQSAAISPYVPTMTTVGNHETYSDTSLSLYKTLFYYENLSYNGIASPRSEVYYSYQLANIMFVHLSTEHVEDQQTSWVSSLMQAAATDANVDWVFSLCHRPYQAEQYVGDISAYLRNTLMPILAQTPKHVMNIGGHHHNYHRGQTRDWPIYHIINGGASWDQYWGQSTEQDFDDVQKTIANWAWQIIDIDLASREMVVDCYSEGYPTPSTQQGNNFVYNSKHIDRFHRKFGLPAPNKPSLTNVISGSVTLPYTLGSSAFSSSSPDGMNSSQFQIAPSSGFTTLSIDKIRDQENLYGDTGSPNYLPVDRNIGINLLTYTIPASGLPNATYYARVRHRDSNTLWSAWSDTVSFTIGGSSQTNTPTMSIPKVVYTKNEAVTITYSGGPGGAKDWIGIYKKGDIPGPTASQKWGYVGAAGTLTLSKTWTDKTEYFVAFFINDGYTEIAPRVPFYVATVPTLTLPKETFANGETVPITYANAPGAATDWIGVYKRGETPGPTPSTWWSYVSGTSGTLNATGLPKGYYFTTYLVNGGYLEISTRQLFSVGTNISQVVVSPTRVSVYEPLTVTFSDGPGTPKDYIGIFPAGGTPGVDPLIDYLYVGGGVSGSVTFTNRLPGGDFFAALLINDSYTMVSEGRNFTVDKLNQSITFSAIPNKTYGDPSFAVSAIASSGLTNITFSLVLGPAVVTGATVVGTGAGTVTLQAGQAGDAYYNAVTTNLSFTVNKASLTCRPADATRFAGQPNPVFTITYSGFVNGDTPLALDAPPVAECSAGVSVQPGTYLIVCSGGSDDNYVYQYQSGTLTVQVVPVGTVIQFH